MLNAISDLNFRPIRRKTKDTIRIITCRNQINNKGEITMKIRKIKVLSFKKNVAQLSNGELLTAILKDDTDFLIQATTLSGDLLPYVRLEGRFQKNQQFYLRLISNEEFVSSNFKKNRHNGVGIILMRLLLTFIADYNKHVEEYKQVKFITGSIVSLGSTDIDYLRAFYRKIDKLTDFENTIRIEMNHEEHEKNSLLYSIVATK
jgi:hypothetical protein